MTKKKKMGEFKPSKYQKAIFDEIECGTHNIVIQAAAGSGKTTTIMNAIHLIPKDKKVLVIAFNKDIVEELQKKASGVKNATIKTLHGLGLAMIYGYLRGLKPSINEFKYRTYLSDNLGRLTKYNLRQISGKRYYGMISTVINLVNIGRSYLCDTEEELEAVARKYSISTKFDEISVALKLMSWGKSNLDVIDFGDMVWLPNSLGMINTRMRYDYVFIDECQDLNVAQRELFLKCMKPNGRFVAVGDKNQGIYAFSGADAESFDKIVALPNTVSLPLSITYRCPKEIVEFAQKIVGGIEWNPDNNTKGIIEEDSEPHMIEDDAMVLCRNNAPLVETYMSMLSQGRKCYIRGRDFGMNMVTVLRGCENEEINQTLSKKGVISELYKDMIDTKNDMVRKFKITDTEAILSSFVQNKYDMIQSMITLSRGCHTKNELIEKIENVFSDHGEGIALSTIHKAKGLEADNVYILEKSLMPSSSAKEKWEVEQEEHLMYVAYTRPKRKLSFLREKQRNGGNIAVEIVNNIQSIEMIINRLYGISNTEKLMDSGYSKVVIECADDMTISAKVQSIGQIKSENTKNNTSGMFSVVTKKGRKIKF